MKPYLFIPRPPLQPGGRSSLSYRIKLHFRPNHPASHYGLGVLLLGREIFDGAMLDYLSARVGAWIETDNAEAVCGALGISFPSANVREKNDH